MRIFILALCGLFEVTVSAAEQGKIEPGGSARLGSVFRAEPAIFAGSARLEFSSRSFGKIRAASSLIFAEFFYFPGVPPWETGNFLSPIRAKLGTRYELNALRSNTGFIFAENRFLSYRSILQVNKNILNPARLGLDFEPAVPARARPGLGFFRKTLARFYPDSAHSIVRQRKVGGQTSVHSDHVT